jgi:HlyD family secretion protein
VPVIILVLVLLAGGGGWLWWQGRPTASAGALVATGAVEAKEYQVAPALAGRIRSVSVAEGDRVTKGQKLIVLDAKAFELQLTQAREGVKAAKAAVTNARDDGSKADVTAAKARLAQAQAAVSLAKVQLGYATITAPHAGTVVTVTANAGQNASPGRTLITLTDPSDLSVRVFVPETRIGTVAIGQPVTVVSDGSSTGFDGTVSFIASESEFTPNNVETREQRVKLVYEVRVRLADSTGVLKSGMPVDVTFR